MYKIILKKNRSPRFKDFKILIFNWFPFSFMINFKGF